MKQDHRRISSEKHEIAYCRKIARQIYAQRVTWTPIPRVLAFRLAKAYLKATKGYSRKRK